MAAVATAAIRMSKQVDFSGEEHDVVEWAFSAVRSRVPNPPKLPMRRRAKRYERNDTPDASVPGLEKLAAPAEAAAREPSTGTNPDDIENPEIRELAILMKRLRENQAANRRPSGLDGRRPRRPLGVPSLGVALGREIRERGWEGNLADGWIFGHWPDIAGEYNAQLTKPVSLRKSVLYVDCASSAVASNLLYAEREFVAKIEDKVGQGVVTKIVFNRPKQRKNYEGRQWVKPQGSQDTYG